MAARAHGYKVGSYHFFSTLTPATLQARQFLKNSYVKSGDLPPVLDVEPTKAQIQKMGGVYVLLSRMRIWLRMVEKETGKRPIIYVSQTFVNRYLSKTTDIKQNIRYGLQDMENTSLISNWFSGNFVLMVGLLEFGVM